jgi:hypothetical protein
MPFLVCDEPTANLSVFPGPLTFANGGVSSGMVIAARAKVLPAATASPANPPDPAMDPACIELEVDGMTGQNWWLSPDKVIPGVNTGGHKLVLWGRSGTSGINWETPTDVPITGQANAIDPVLPAPATALLAWAASAPAAPAAGWPGAFNIRVKRNVLSTNTTVPYVRELLNAGALQAAPFVLNFDIVTSPPGGLVWSSTTSTVIPEDPNSLSKWILYVPDITQTLAKIFLIQQIHTTVNVYGWYIFAFNPAAPNLFVPSPTGSQLRHNLSVFP